MSMRSRISFLVGSILIVSLLTTVKIATNVESVQAAPQLTTGTNNRAMFSYANVTRIYLPYITNFASPVISAPKTRTPAPRKTTTVPAPTATSIQPTVTNPAPTATLTPAPTIGATASPVPPPPGSISQNIISADRKTDWTYAGIPGGVPQRTTICQTINSATYGNGVTDATAAIQNALSSCPDNQVVYLPAGQYVVTKTIWLRSYDILRGAGPGSTVIKHTGSDTGSIIGTSNDIWTALVGSPRTYNITQAVKDAQVITLSSVTGISPGDVLLLNQVNDGSLVTQIGNDGSNPTNCTFCGIANGTRSLGQFVEVSSISGNQVTLKQPLHWTYNTSLSPWAYLITPGALTRWAGVENLTLTQDSAAAGTTVFLQGAQYSWIKNVEITNVVANAIMTYYAFQSEIRENYLHTAFSYANSEAYGIVLTMYSSNNLVENNLIDTLSNGGIENHGGASGNVMAYNYLHNVIYSANNSWLISSPSANHGAYPKMNLWEGNFGYKIGADIIWGTSGYNTFFRSQSAGWMKTETTTANNAVEIQKGNYYFNIVGNILGTAGKSNRYEALPGQSPTYTESNMVIWALGVRVGGRPEDPNVAPTTLRHGNYDYVTNSVVWDPKISSRSLPASLYRTSKPSWWCQEVPWPPIGPDVAGLVNAIPAQRRFEGKTCTH